MIKTISVWVAVIAIVILAVVLVMSKEGKPTTSNTTPMSETTTSTATGTKKVVSGSGAVIHTNEGDIEVVFFIDKAPKTVENFVTLAKSNFYDMTKFHRVIKGFMIQGGDPLSKGIDTSVYGRGGPGYQFADEINSEKLVRGVLAMANSGPNTNGSQFFIVTAASTPWLDGLHTAFGKVVKGMDIVEKIEATQTGSNDLPMKPIVVTGVEVK